MKNEVSIDEVSNFKEIYCNENQLIIELIKNKLQDFFIEPVLDVGCGTGDIAYQSLSKKKVIGIDVNNVNVDEFFISKKHTRIEGSFFEYTPNEKINTMLISHTLQFIHHNTKRLNKKIKEINAKNIILVANRNDDFMGEMINWVDTNYKKSSPERKIDGFPIGYQLIKKVPFIASLVCKNFPLLAEQVSYLMLIDITKRKNEVITFLKNKLQKPEFTINQDILVYEKR